MSLKKLIKLRAFMWKNEPLPFIKGEISGAIFEGALNLQTKQGNKPFQFTNRGFALL